MNSADELRVTLFNSLRGLDTDLSKHLVWSVSPDPPTWNNEYDFAATLPYPYSLNAGDMRLTIGNTIGAADTSTILFVEGLGSEDPPYFDPAPNNITTYPVEELTLETRVRGSRPVKIEWFVRKPGAGSPVPINTDSEKYELQINGSLTISKFGEEDEGVYFVQVSNSAGIATEVAELDVVYSAGYSDWTDWTTCSADCEGTRTRTRFCNNPPPKQGYPSCTQNKEVETESCGAEQCPGFSEWTEWGDCSKECGYGQRSRTRDCDSPAPVQGGPQCDGLSVETKVCYLKKCPERSKT